ncbi:MULTISPECIES: nucleotidyltransferase family protein [unclassified Actinomyces]|uniref:nucleotidyltransferase family protein n=1 Tax=unclassified Actinomyces TaxID=2609248 RepID=UPI00201834A9|nr:MULTISPECIES: nucleotidyltransferase family protein [unclassified Actinomyces]MCL3776921.1 nucleotidyltransferase family protein [Actinomyces sp. AC-20-1]MCL3789158.1 nucleotidyltransferase family protein [Actinomyces sp. 187325]MCL3792452.1 nucleotidyltransferase family protein [Actinomyces sp. 186855]MCL3794229.1 nucleotidyltransferase family protein [Actinomyces sp. 217892]
MTASTTPAPRGTRTALVLARGLGTRMRAASDASGMTAAQAAAAASGYKALMPIGEHRLIDYSMSALADAGIERIVLVVGPEHEDFAAHIDSLGLSRVRVELAVQVEPRGTANAVLSAAEVIGDEPFLMVNGDNYYPVEGMRELAERGGNALLGFDRAALVAGSNIPAERVAAFALVKASDGVLTDIIEKPAPEVVEAAGEHALVSMNCFGFTPKIFDACRSIGPSARGEYEIVDAVRALPGPVAVIPTRGAVLDLSRREDIADVEARLATTAVVL